jgi:hypothetical protein
MMAMTTTASLITALRVRARRLARSAFATSSRTAAAALRSAQCAAQIAFSSLPN